MSMTTERPTPASERGRGIVQRDTEARQDPTTVVSVLPRAGSQDTNGTGSNGRWDRWRQRGQNIKQLASDLLGTQSRQPQPNGDTHTAPEQSATTDGSRTHPARSGDRPRPAPHVEPSPTPTSDDAVLIKYRQRLARMQSSVENTIAVSKQDGTFVTVKPTLEQRAKKRFTSEPVPVVSVSDETVQQLGQKAAAAKEWVTEFVDDIRGGGKAPQREFSPNPAQFAGPKPFEPWEGNPSVIVVAEPNSVQGSKPLADWERNPDRPRPGESLRAPISTPEKSPQEKNEELGIMLDEMQDRNPEALPAEEFLTAAAPDTWKNDYSLREKLGMLRTRISLAKDDVALRLYDSKLMQTKTGRAAIVGAVGAYYATATYLRLKHTGGTPALLPPEALPQPTAPVVPPVEHMPPPSAPIGPDAVPPRVVPPVETLPQVPTSPDVPQAGPSVAEPPALPHVESTHSPSLEPIIAEAQQTQPGGSYWRLIEHAYDRFDPNGWTNEKNGVTKAQVLADLFTDFAKQNGADLPMLHPGDSLPPDFLSKLHLSEDQKQVLLKALSTRDARTYINDVMPLVEKVKAGLPLQ